MFFSSWLRKRTTDSRAKRSALQRQARFRPRMEMLEDRTTPSVAYFLADDGIHGQELWTTDGTAAGTALLKDVNPGAAGSNIRNMIDVNGTLYFGADDGVHGRELWKSDGTEVGTVLVKDINPGLAQGLASYTFEPVSLVYFSASDSKYGRELWKSDGTTAGTVLVKDINPNGLSIQSVSTSMIAVGNTLYFGADDGSHGEELWKTDGTAAGTVLVADIVPGVGSSNPRNMAAPNGQLYFTARDLTGDFKLWTSDGTDAGTTVFLDMAFSGAHSSTNVQMIDGRLYISSDETGLLSSDGTQAETLLLHSGCSGPVAALNGQVIFGAYDPDHGTELWLSDGTSEGTLLLADIVSGEIGSYPMDFVVVG